MITKIKNTVVFLVAFAVAKIVGVWERIRS